MYISQVYKVISGKYGIKLWIASDAKMLCLQHGNTHWQEWWRKGEEAGPSSCKIYGLSHVWNRKLCNYW